MGIEFSVGLKQQAGVEQLLKSHLKQQQQPEFAAGATGCDVRANTPCNANTSPKAKTTVIFKNRDITALLFSPSSRELASFSPLGNPPARIFRRSSRKSDLARQRAQ